MISDTHGLLRPEVPDALRGSDAIIHAGDVGRIGILEELGKIAPVTAIRGNVDIGPEFDVLPDSRTVELAGTFVHIVHDLKSLQALDRRVRLVVSGHSHKHAQEVRDGVMFVNPGSAGPRRFRLPITVAKIDLATEPWQVQFIYLT